ncbi:unnamed protein product [Closterium sp. NIES-64]|nr:unnamed protein product [Closterium sp. NIES-64]
MALTESFQPFPRGETEVSVALDIPDGDWVVVLNAPAGGIRGTVHAPPPGTQRLVAVGAASTVELSTWGSCALKDDVALAANQTLPSGGAAGAPPYICRDTCARLVGCLPATCGRPFTEREVAGAFVDCARMCIVAPSSITTYAGSPCPMVRSLSHGALPVPCRILHRCFPTHHATSQVCTSYLHVPASHARLPAPPSVLAMRMCIIAPSSITTYADTSCPMVRPLPLAPLPAPWCVPCPLLLSLPHGAPPAPWCAPCPMPTLPVSPSLLPATQLFFQCLFTHPLQPEIASLFANTPCNVSDQQRLTVLQVAASCAFFTIAKDRCLAGHGPGSKRSHTLGGPGSVRWHMVATLCTILGGPVTTMDECRMYGADGKQVMTLVDMFAYLKYRHIGHMISAQHMVRWVQTVAAAVSSVTPVPDVAAARLNALMHSFNDAIISSNGVGCSQGAHGRWSWWWLDA